MGRGGGARRDQAGLNGGDLMTRIALLALFALAALPCAAQYPERNVTFLANFPPGGLVDTVTRVIAEGMKPKFPHGIAVVNKPGAGGAVGVSDLVQAKPDGYTILLTPQSSPALLGKHIEAAVAQPGEVKPLVDGKRMRVLVVFQEKRHPAFPEVPTAKEAGWDVANGVWYLIIAPKGTPASAVKYIHDAAKAVVDDPAFAKTMDARGGDVDYRAGDRLRADLWKEYKLDTQILKRIGLIKP